MSVHNDTPLCLRISQKLPTNDKEISGMKQKTSRYLKKFNNFSCYFTSKMGVVPISVADPGFPVGGVHPLGGGMDLRRGHFSVKMYAKTKELGPIGGGVRLARPPPPDPPMHL